MTNFARSPDVILQCDGPSCLMIPSKAPRVYVPAKATGEENHQHEPVTLAFPHLHYCDKCWENEVKLDSLLTEEARGRIERRGAKIWPHGVKPDFDAALIQPIDVFSPEYGAYMERLGLKTDGLGYRLHASLERRLHGR